MMTHLAVLWYSQIAPRVTPHQQNRDDFSLYTIFPVKSIIKALDFNLKPPYISNKKTRL
jgi:hypothetical protein